MNGLITDTNTGDLLVSGKTAVITGSEEHVCESVLLAMRGEFKEFPLLGAEVRTLMGGCKDPFWATDTKRMLKACKVNVTTVSQNADGTITIE